MADTKISGLTALTGANTASGDLLTIVDVSDTTMAATGTNKKITLTELQSAPVSAGTANGVLYLNGSKVATSGSALVFDGTNLGVGVTPSAGSTHIDVSAGGSFYGLGNGAQLAANSNFSSGSWLYRSSAFASRIDINPGNAGGVAFYTAASGTAGNAITFTQAMTLDTSGNLGIGTSSPSYKLQVYNNINGTPFAWGNATRTGYLYQDQNGVGITNAAGTGFDEGVFLDTANSKVVLYTNSTDRVTLDSSGNLGLGVTPSAWANGRVAFDVKSNGAVYSGTNMVGLSGNAYDDGSWKRKAAAGATLYEASSQHAWYITGSGTAGSAISWTQAMTLDASGRLGIGATSLTEYLTVKSPNASTFFSLQTATDSGVYMGNNVGALTLLTASTERARIDSSGNLLVGTTDTSGANTTGFEFFYGSGSSRLYVGHVTGTVTGTYYHAFNYAGTTIGSITQSGTTAVLYNTTSDQRLKENIADADSASTLIDSLQVRKYDWKSDGSHQRYGFVAQELVTVAPEAVHQPTDPEEMMAVDYSKLVPMLVKEIQSLRARVAQLESN